MDNLSCVNVFLIDDHAVLLESLARLLEIEPDIHVVGTARRAEDALPRIADLNVDIVLMDVDLPGMSGLEAADRILRTRLRTRIVFLSAYWNDAFIERALRLKAGGYLTKMESAARVVKAIRTVAEGETVYSDELRQRFELCGRATPNGHGHRTPLSTLTPRELEILRCLSTGMHKPQIARDLRISIKTVAAHTSNIMRKLDIHDRVDLARYAIREHLVRV